MKVKIVAYIIVGIITLFGGVIGVLYYNTSIIVSAEPSDSKILLDNTVIQNNQKQKILPRNHTIQVQKQGYIPYTNNLKIGIGKRLSTSVHLRVLPQAQKITTDTAKFAVLSDDKISMYYLTNNGKALFSINDIYASDISVEKISPDFFSDITDIVWSPDRKLAIIKTPDTTSLYDFKRYDLLHQEITPFKEGIGDIAWTPDSQNIIYYYAPNDGQVTLVEATKTNTDTQILYNFKDTQITNPLLDISPDGQSVLVVYPYHQMYLLDLYTKKLINIETQSKVIDAIYTSDGKIIYLAEDGNYLYNPVDFSSKKLDFKTNLSRITFIDNENIIYTQKNTDNTFDFYTYNILNDEKNMIYYDHKGINNPTNIVVSSDGQYVFFESNSSIYRLKVDYGQY